MVLQGGSVPSCPAPWGLQEILLEAAGCAGELLQGVSWLYPPLLSAVEEQDRSSQAEPWGGLRAGGKLSVGFPSSDPPSPA